MIAQDFGAPVSSEEEDPQRQTASGSATTAAAGSTPTFATLQQTGQPRPPAPTPVPAVSATVAPAPAASGATAAPSANAAFEQALKDRYTTTSSAQAPTAPGGATPQAAPVYNPTVNPFQATASTPLTGTPFQAGTFAPSSAGAPVSDATRQAVLQLLGSPDPYSSDVAKSTYDRLAGAVDDQYNVQNQQIQEEMARRGITASSIYGGRLQDSNAMRKTAKEDIASRILDTQAQTNAAARAAAIAAGQSYGAQQYGQDLSTYETNRDSGQQGFANTMTQAQIADALRRGNFADALAAATFNGQQDLTRFNTGLAGAQFGASENQRSVQDALAQFQATQAAQGQQFDQGRSTLQDYLGYGQQGFNNQLATAQVNNSQQAQYQALLQQLLGLQ